jgi:predicted permease
MLPLRFAAAFVLLTMLAVTIWASLQVALWNTPREVATHPWFIATLFDTYFAFLTFYVWLAYKETSNLARVLWLLAVLLLGNIAMAIYLLRELFRLPANATMEDLLLRRKATPAA